MSLQVLDPAPLDALAEDLGDPVALASMLATFCDSVLTLRAAAADAWTARDDDGLRQVLRDLAATAAMFGAGLLATTCRDLSGRIGDPARPLASSALQRLDEECSATRTAVHRYIASTAYDDARRRPTTVG